MQMPTDIHNYYEKLVVDFITHNKLDQKFSEEFLADMCCIVLNQLPSKYIRHEVDMAFYLPQAERFEMEMNVKEAIGRAMEFMSSRDTRDAED
ncbi:late competence development ComFB family protein [Psychrosphaera ytuae]|uniref:Late competence development ComFB family protein n=1 Tax=Psychrosphaera ytuae TaxID=2820710 RepID=A0A975DCS6_9GAMM|nr:late competence development ComFB family protein [Psychrosphaera ytuae]QTH64777.1 late competence development ComFB family protein [Psychrosphaera ytuae]